MKSLSYSITSRTPIVTGDHDHRNTELQATGILGSLRYQYWLLKAVQAWQTDPDNPVYPRYTDDLPAKGAHNKREFLLALDKAGSVVQLFGDTNWKKMFRLEIADAPQKEEGERGQACSARSGKKIPYHWKNFKLTFQQDRKSRIFDELAENKGINLEDELHSLMSFVHHYGWLGAAPQNGLGWVRVECDNAAGELHEIEKADCIIPPPANPVFFAEDVALSTDCFNGLLKTLQEFYQEKTRRADRMITYYNKKSRLNREEQKDLKKHKDGKPRYKKSLEYIESKTENPPPVGYEVRRWIKQINSNYQFFDRDTDEKKDCNYVHVTHPVTDPSDRETYRFRLRCCTRPDAPEDTRKKVALLPGIAQIAVTHRLTPYQLTEKASKNLYSHAECADSQQQESLS